MKPRAWEVMVNATAVVALLVVLLWLVSLITDPISHEDLDERLTSIDNQLSYVACLLLIEPPDRSPEAIAGCLG